ncbi:MATE family efflux transporter [Peptostreptococcus russellii]|uniref:MATE family efflux transporter n=1 Tax=Peptostreptococcus russellii TaxID=215200 RepID=UPI001FABA692|nr:MATE family efflux transporter [Peptostreptococcus russellii]
MEEKNMSVKTEVQYNNPLGYEKISKLLYKFSVPAIIGMTVNALYNVVDRIFIGNSPDLGANGLAAITICFPAMIIIMSVGILLGQGGATLFSISLGKGDNETADKTLGNATSMLLILGAIITIFGSLFLDKLLILFGASETVLPFAKEYMRIIFIGTLFQVIGMGMNNFLRSDGKPKLSMATMFIGAGINIILDPILIYGFRMGMSGAAIATITSQFISMIWSIHHFLKKDAKHRIQKKYLRLDFKLCKEIISLGMPGFILQLANSSLALLLNSYLLKYGGDIGVSAMGIVNSLMTLLILPVIGLNQGLQPIVSFNYGAEKYDRVKKAVKLAIVAGVSITTIGFILSHLVPNILVSMFNREPELLKSGVHALKVWTLCLPVAGFQIIAANFFQAIGMPKRAMLLTLMRQVIALMPCIVILAPIMGIDGILFAAPIADALSAVVTAMFFFPFIKKFTNREQTA